MTRPCNICGRYFTARASYHRKCLDCWKEEQNAAVWERGYQAGVRDTAASRSSASSSSGLSMEALKTLRTLTHPDLHSGKRKQLATQITQWLNNEIDERRAA